MNIDRLPRSGLLGARAGFVYAQFIESLAADGDIAECGVFSGVTSREMVKYVESRGLPKVVHMFDSFAGLPNIAIPGERSGLPTDPTRPGAFYFPRHLVEETMHGLTRFVIHEGLFSETLLAFNQPLCFIHADADLYLSTVEIVKMADRCLSEGGRIVFDDYGDPLFPGIELAVAEYIDLALYDIVVNYPYHQCVAVKRSTSLS